MAYAQDTKVPIAQTRAEIEALVYRNGAKSFGCVSQPGVATIIFETKERRLRFDLPLHATPKRPGANPRNRLDQEHRALWRALLLTIKAKFESVASGIEVFDEAFMAHVVLPDGSTVGQQARPRIAEAYKTQKMVPLLPAPGGQP